MHALRATDPRRIGPYDVTHRLGAGGMGEVYLARSRTGLRLAVKVVRAEHAEDRTFRARFRHEVRAARTVGGAGTYTARVVDADTEAERPWMATEFVSGPNLRDAVLDHGALPGPAVRILAAALGEALAAIHAKGLVHRDLKPSNILLGPDGPRVIDFGIVRALEATALTRTGAVVGSVGYVSPEQIRNGGQVGPPSDVFSLGAVLAYAAAGREPFGEGQDSVVLLRILTRDFDLSGVPEGIRPLVASCLREDPLERPEPAEVVASAGFTPKTLRTAARPGWYGPAATAHPPTDDRPSGVEYLAPTPPPPSTTPEPPLSNGAPVPDPPATGTPPASAGTSAAGTPSVSAGTSAAGSPSVSAGTPAPVTPSVSAGTPATGTPSASASTPAVGTTPVSAGSPTGGTPSASAATTPSSARAETPAAGTTPAAAEASAAATAPASAPSSARAETPAAGTTPAAAEASATATPPASPASPAPTAPSATATPPVAPAPATGGPATPGSLSTPASPQTPTTPTTPTGRLGPIAPGRRRVLKTFVGGAGVVAGAGVGAWVWRYGFGTESRGGADRSPGRSATGADRPAVLRWQYDLGGIGGLDGACCALSPDGSVVYAGTSGGVLHAISRDGSRRWKVRLGDDVSTPVATRDAVYCVVGFEAEDVRRLTAVSPSGSPLWTRTLGDRGYAVPVLLGADVLVSIGGTDAGGLRRYASDGSENWTATTPAGPTGTPVVAAGTIYTGSYGDALLALDARDGSRKWQVSAGADVTVLALAGTTLFTDSAAERQGHRVTDGRRLWRTEADAGPLTGGGRALAVGTESAAVYAVRAADGSRAWTYALKGAAADARAVVAGDTVYARAGEGVWALDLNGTPRWSAALGRGAADDQHTPVVRGTRLYVPSGTGIAAIEVSG
ncbi:serine/threonine protein kinase [Streptomyces sp. FBKL.4005]|uniref:serine/threonine-protein kinase n=1 Tax=Streptomyces sp. FBKL.4005 TaxID=2015515 RepID=UPI000B96F8B7|nr:serine/threonine-protein kinase [Streptomyces sp. FBKL.4005]OYP18057.1 serine/threonine protein kinase [Streptomyces sp. FBKL.4005]